MAPQTRAAVAAPTLAAFEDPTLALDEHTFGQVQAAVLVLPEGDTLLVDARQAQRAAVAEAIHRVFLCSAAILFLTLVLTLLLKERPLRRTVVPAAADAREPAAAAGSPATTASTHDPRPTPRPRDPIEPSPPAVRGLVRPPHTPP